MADVEERLEASVRNTDALRVSAARQEAQMANEHSTALAHANRRIAEGSSLMI